MKEGGREVKEGSDEGRERGGENGGMGPYLEHMCNVRLVI